MSDRAREIVERLNRYQFSVTNEAELQQGLWLVLQRYPDAQREVVLDARCRIDFLVGGTGIEVKVDGSIADLIRQLIRYSKFEQVLELVVVSTRAKHRDVPAEIGGKPVFLAYLGDGAL